MEFQMDGFPPDALRRLLEEMPGLAIAPSGLVGVVAVSKVVEDAGVSVEVLSVEVREAGALVHWRSRANRSIGFILAAVSITDDRGTVYQTSTATGGGNERSWTGELAVVPAPPDDATLTWSSHPSARTPTWACPAGRLASLSKAAGNSLSIRVTFADAERRRA